MKTKINYRKNIVRTIHHYKHLLKYCEGQELPQYETNEYYEDRVKMIQSIKSKLLLLDELLKDQKHKIINFHEYDY